MISTEMQPWRAHYPPSVSPTIDPDRYPSLVSLLEDALKRYSSLPMYENMGRVLTYGQVDELSQAFAAYLQHHTALQPGDSVAIQLPNLLQYPVALLGVLRAGMVVVNVNPLYTPHETAHQLQDAGAKAVLVLANFAHHLEGVLPQTDLQTVLITEVGDLLGSVRGKAVSWAVKYLKRMVPRYHLPQAIPFRHALRTGRQSAPLRPVPLQAHQPALLQYTGGTTGVAKGAVLTHRNMVANIEQMVACMRVRLQDRTEVAITPLPLYHIFSLTVNLLGMMQLGAKNVLITNPRDIASFVRTLQRHRFTFISGVNPLFKGLLARKDFANVDFSALKMAIAGGVALQESVALQWEAVTGTPLLQGYGLTEASPVVACNMCDGTHRTGTIGIPMPSTNVKIVDDSGQTVPPGTPGELLVQGPQVMQAYWHQPDETALALEAGWLRTGDMAVMDRDGFLQIVDRKKEMINVSGFNVYPSEVEAAVEAHPQVEEAAAIGVADVAGQEVVKVYVVPKAPGLTAEALLAHCRTRLTGYKVPKHVTFCDSLPKSAVGKILRQVLQRNDALNQKPLPS